MSIRCNEYFNNNTFENLTFCSNCSEIFGYWDLLMVPTYNDIESIFTLTYRNGNLNYKNTNCNYSHPDQKFFQFTTRWQCDFNTYGTIVSVFNENKNDYVTFIINSTIACV